MVKLIRLAAAFLLCLVMVSSTRATAEADAIPVPAPYSPKTGVIFNKPTGTRDQQYAIIDHINKSIDSSPKGSTIRVAAYSFSAQSTAAALTRAYDRGVWVKVLVDSHVWTTEMTKLKKLLGTNKSKNSYFATCHYSCMSAKASFQHSKLYMFSTSGSSRLVSMISSSNPADTGAVESWNNLYTVANDNTLYASNRKYFQDMLKDKTQPNYYRTVESGNLKEYYFPRKTGDTIYNVLSDISCNGAAAGYGNSGGHTVIRVAMYRWTTLRVNLAKKLWALDNSGCDVQVIYTADVVETPVAAALLKKGGRHGGIPVYNGRIARHNDGDLDTYIHHKYVTINGVYQGNPASKIVFTGSCNFTMNTLRNSTEILLKVNDAAVTTAFEKNFREIRDNWTKKVTSPIQPPPVPPRIHEVTPDARTLEKQAADEKQAAAAGDDYWVSPDE